MVSSDQDAPGSRSHCGRPRGCSRSLADNRVRREADGGLQPGLGCRLCNPDRPQARAIRSRIRRARCRTTTWPAACGLQPRWTRRWPRESYWPQGSRDVIQQRPCEVLPRLSAWARDRVHADRRTSASRSKPRRALSRLSWIPCASVRQRVRRKHMPCMRGSVSFPGRAQVEGGT